MAISFQAPKSLINYLKFNHFEYFNCIRNKFKFELWSIEKGFSSKKTGQTLQVNLIFINKNEIKN